MDRISRRDVLRLGVAGAGAVAGARLLGPSVASAGTSAAGLDDLAARTLAAAKGRTGTLKDIEHLVVIIQENRSFDHYFGLRKDVRGFADTDVLESQGKPIWYQTSTSHNDGYVLPWRMDSQHSRGQCPADPAHNWPGMHNMWNKGAMDQFAKINGQTAMGYLGREDIPWYYGIADNFTVCDAYFCSTMSSTSPNRYYSVTGTIDIDAVAGGPAIMNDGYWYAWETYPERLDKAGVSWRMYHDTDDFDDNVLKFFRQYQGLEHTSDRWQNAMRNRKIAEFEADVKAGELPNVSYIISPADKSEHPEYSSVDGQEYVRRHVEALVKEPKVWAKTVVLITYDENGGFFDHVAPPVPEPGTKGELLADVPIGLGFRVPTMVISPWSTGGKVVSDTFDHTSILRFCETRWGAEVPNLTAWRRETCGDLTSCLDMTNFDPKFPRLPSTRELARTLDRSCQDQPPNQAPATQALPKVEA
jgi:phospholipase C